MPGRLAARANKAAVAMFLVAALLVGFVMGQRSVTAATPDDLLQSRVYAEARHQCLVDILMLPTPPEDRLASLGGDPDFRRVCVKARRRVAPGSPAPDFGPPTKENP